MFQEISGKMTHLLDKMLELQPLQNLCRKEYKKVKIKIFKKREILFSVILIFSVPLENLIIYRTPIDTFVTTLGIQELFEATLLSRVYIRIIANIYKAV